MGRVKVAFIGCGDVSELHYLGVQACPQAELVGIYDPNLEVLKKRSEQWHIKTYQQLEEILENRDIDAVFVLAPIDSHYSLVMKSLQAGKHVLIEKPVAATVHEVEEMERYAKSIGLQCMPAHNYIYLPEVVRLKKNLEKGAFGQVAVSWFLFNIHQSEEMAARYPGIAQQVGTHLLYTHRYLFGEPETITATSSNLLYPHLDREDQISMTLKMPDGSISHLFASFVVSDHSSDPWTFVVKVLGTKGSTQISWRDIVFERALGTLSQSYGQYEETYENEINYFINECIIRNKPPLSTLHDAAAVLNLVNHAVSIANVKK